MEQLDFTKYLKAIKILNDKKIDYLIVGGWAVILHGVYRGTQDIDLIINTNDINKLIDEFYLNNIKIIQYIDRNSGKIEFYEEIEKAKNYCLHKKGISVKFYDLENQMFMDIIDYAKDKFEEISKESDIFNIDGIDINTCSKENLIKLKEETKDTPGREQDIIDIAKIKKIINNGK